MSCTPKPPCFLQQCRDSLFSAPQFSQHHSCFSRTYHTITPTSCFWPPRFSFPVSHRTLHILHSVPSFKQDLPHLKALYMFSVSRFPGHGLFLPAPDLDGPFTENSSYRLTFPWNSVPAMFCAFNLLTTEAEMAQGFCLPLPYCFHIVLSPPWIWSFSLQVFLPLYLSFCISLFLGFSSNPLSLFLVISMHTNRPPINLFKNSLLSTTTKDISS